MGKVVKSNNSHTLKENQFSLKGVGMKQISTSFTFGVIYCDYFIIPGFILGRGIGDSPPILKDPPNFKKEGLGAYNNYVGDMVSDESSCKKVEETLLLRQISEAWTQY